MANTIEAPEFSVQDVKLTRDERSIAVELDVNDKEQKRWLVGDCLGYNAEVTEAAVQYPMSATAKLSCNGRAEFFVGYQTSATCKVDIDNEYIGLNPEDTKKLTMYLSEILPRQGEIPRWLEDMQKEPLDMPNLKLTDLQVVHSAIPEVIPLSRFELPQNSISFVCDLTTDDAFFDTLINRTTIFEDVNWVNGIDKEDIDSLSVNETYSRLADMYKCISTITNAQFVAVLNSDMTIDGSIQFNPALQGDKATLKGVGVRLTEKEKVKVIDAAREYKAHLLEQISHSTVAYDLTVDDAFFETLTNRSNIFEAMNRAGGYSPEYMNTLPARERYSRTAEVYRILSEGFPEITNARFVAELNADMITETRIEFEPAINGGYEKVAEVNLTLTEEEKSKVMSAAREHKLSLPEQVLRFNDEWKYLPAAKLGYEQDSRDARERDIRDTVAEDTKQEQSQKQEKRKNRGYDR